jgi:drug/metabolite transporter (DMT)-like permease
MKVLSGYAKGVIQMVTSSLMFSVMGMLIVYAKHINFFTTALYRFLVGVFILSTLALFRRIKLNYKNSKILFLRGFLGSISAVLFFLAIAKLGIAKGTVISFMYPIFATIGGMIFLKERVKPLAWVVMLTALVGVTFLTYEAESNMLRLDLWTLLAFAGAIIGGLALVCVKLLTRSDSSSSILMSQCLIGFWLVVIPANIAPAQVGLWGIIILLGVGFSATLAQLLMNDGFTNLSIPTGSLLGLVTPVCNVFIGILLFGEILNTLALVGVFLVLVSCGAIVWVDRIKLRP